MKILFFSSEFPPLPGGIGNHACQLAQALNDSGHSVTVLTDHRSVESEAEEKAFDRSLPFVVVRVQRYRHAWQTYLTRVLQAVQLLCREEPEAVLASGRFPLWLAAGLSLFFPRPRYFAIVHGSEIGAGSGRERALTRWSLSRFAGIIAVSQFTKTLLDAARPGLPVRVIPNGFTPLAAERPESAPRLKGRPALITVGNVSRRKGQHNVIRALPQIRALFPEAHYHMVGIPSEQAAVMQLAAELNVADAVTFHGAVSQEALPRLLAGSDIFLMLSERLPNGDVEGFGIAILEGNDFGLPAIGANDCGIADAIRDGYSGRLVSPHDPQAVCEALQDIIENYQSYSAQAREWAEGFLWERVIERYLEVLDYEKLRR